MFAHCWQANYIKIRKQVYPSNKCLKSQLGEYANMPEMISCTTTFICNVSSDIYILQNRMYTCVGGEPMYKKSRLPIPIVNLAKRGTLRPVRGTQCCNLQAITTAFSPKLQIPCNCKVFNIIIPQFVRGNKTMLQEEYDNTAIWLIPMCPSLPKPKFFENRESKC